MSKSVRVTYAHTSTVLTGRAVLPRVLFILLGIVLFKSVYASDAFEPDRGTEPLGVKWLIVPRAAVETIALMEEENTDGDS